MHGLQTCSFQYSFGYSGTLFSVRILGLPSQFPAKSACWDFDVDCVKSVYQFMEYNHLKSIIFPSTNMDVFSFTYASLLLLLNLFLCYNFWWFINGVIYSNSDCSLLVYRNTIDFYLPCILQPCQTHLLVPMIF